MKKKRIDKNNDKKIYNIVLNKNREYRNRIFLKFPLSFFFNVNNRKPFRLGG